MEPALFIRTLAEIEQDHILATLAHCNGNRTRTARLLRISLRCLRNKLHLYQKLGCNVCAHTNAVYQNKACDEPPALGNAQWDI